MSPAVNVRSPPAGGVEVSLPYTVTSPKNSVGTICSVLPTVTIVARVGATRMRPSCVVFAVPLKPASTITSPPIPRSENPPVSSREPPSPAFEDPPRTSTLPPRPCESVLLVAPPVTTTVPPTPPDDRPPLTSTAPPRHFWVHPPSTAVRWSAVTSMVPQRNAEESAADPASPVQPCSTASYIATVMFRPPHS